MAHAVVPLSPRMMSGALARALGCRILALRDATLLNAENGHLSVIDGYVIDV
jgi:hypothetical protein